MTYSYDDILTALKNGADPADIAKQFTDDLNRAIDVSSGPTPYEEASCAFAEAWEDLLQKYCDENHMEPEAEWHITGEEVRELLPTLIEVLQKFTSVYRELTNLFATANAGVNTKAPVKNNTDGEDYKGRSLNDDDFDALVKQLLNK